MSSEFDLESFSRIGKSLSNASSLRSIRESLESSRQQTRRSREISFVSLSEVNTQIVDFHVDRGRHAVMLSSPRSESLQDSSSTTRNPFQHLVSLEDKNSLRASKMRKRQADKLHENRFISQRGSRELDAKPPKEKLVLPSSSFLAPERKESVYYKMQDKRYAAVPPIGHYDASYELVRPKTARLCYIAAKQHNVRSSSPQGHFKVSETHFTRSKSFEYAPSSISKSVENEMTSSPFNLRGEEERLMFSPQERKENSRDLQESISQVSFRRGHDPSEIQSTDQNSWLRPEKTQDFNKTSGRFVGDRALIAGYLALSRKEMFDLEYSPSVEILEITKRHTPTPDLSRSGRDHNDALERLGYVTPERTAATPYYPKVADPIRWSEQRNWFHATHPNVRRHCHRWFLRLLGTEQQGKCQHEDNASKEMDVFGQSSPFGIGSARGVKQQPTSLQSQGVASNVKTHPIL
uniref:Uncharacterized protein n=1 Tax=Guillardia theta TaxID=55529 RepID=A0A6U6CP43_GUITH|mmetsp:Transcript_47930/g.150347  ORF Transcript_47930/g.150347 Transcript_47930/m.150347 type:complete len:464 (+) Transcript_47930:155-1546(+)